MKFKSGKNKILVLFLVLSMAAIIRYLYTSSDAVMFADQWRHLSLVRNIRAGLGFSQYAGQPYIWYNPLWYYLASFFISADNLKWFAALFSFAAVPLFSFFIYRYFNKDLPAAIVGGFLLACFGPFVSLTCQLGSESFALVLLACALLSALGGKYRITLPISGLLFGLSVLCRLHFIFTIFWFFEFFPKTRQRVSFLLFTATPLFFYWLRNHAIINQYPYVFSWDGVATRSSGYNFFSTLIVQLQPEVATATAELYSRTAPYLQWLYQGERFRWEMLSFMLVSLACILATRRRWLIMTALIWAAYFLFFDTTLSARFFRIWVVFIPLMIVAISGVISRLIGKVEGPWATVLPLCLVISLAATGIPDLFNHRKILLQNVTPQPEC